LERLDFDPDVLAAAGKSGLIVVRHLGFVLEMSVR
jgi:hypothetical protein